MLTYRTIFVQFPVGTIKEFYEKCIKTVNDDLEEIEKLNEEGAYEDFSDYESAYSIPLARQRLIYYATLNELSILIENCFRMLARDYYTNVRNKDRLNEANLVDNIEDIFDLFGEHFDKIIKYINKGYGISVREIRGYNQIKHIRDLINAYKHREEHKYKKLELIPLKENIFERYFIHDEDIMKLITDTEKFLSKLFDSTIKNSRMK